MSKTFSILIFIPSLSAGALSHQYRAKITKVRMRMTMTMMMRTMTMAMMRMMKVTMIMRAMMAMTMKMSKIPSEMEEHRSIHCLHCQHCLFCSNCFTLLKQKHVCLYKLLGKFITLSEWPYGLLSKMLGD